MARIYAKNSCNSLAGSLVSTTSSIWVFVMLRSEDSLSLSDNITLIVSYTEVFKSDWLAVDTAGSEVNSRSTECGFMFVGEDRVA